MRIAPRAEVRMRSLRALTRAITIFISVHFIIAVALFTVALLVIAVAVIFGQNIHQEIHSPTWILGLAIVNVGSGVGVLLVGIAAGLIEEIVEDSHVQSIVDMEKKHPRHSGIE